MSRVRAARSPANRFISRTYLIALVRRARQPGVKFDTMPILEGPQDAGKSSALRALCPKPEWFTDNFSFHQGKREDITQSLGKWIIEIPELLGLTKSDREKIKSMLSRQFDEPISNSSGARPGAADRPLSAERRMNTIISSTKRGTVASGR
jgi:predicted P-loop ATPase